MPQEPKLADTNIADARDAERKRAAAAFGSQSTNITGGALAPASTAKKALTGQ